jgi:predicted  nucleic acid-binding Zn-ribbon protein
VRKLEQGGRDLVNARAGVYFLVFPECASLQEQLRETCLQSRTQQLQFEKQTAQLDEQKAELKMEMVELELDKTMRLQEYEKQCNALRDQMEQQARQSNECQSVLEAQVARMKEEIELVRTNLFCCTVI